MQVGMYALYVGELYAWFVVGESADCALFLPRLPSIPSALCHMVPQCLALLSVYTGAITPEHTALQGMRCGAEVCL